MKRILIADTETTGTGKGAKMVEVAWIEVDEGLSVVEEFQSLIDPEMPIPADASGVHNIGDADVGEEPTAEELFDFVLKDQDFSEVLLICHNVAFDQRFLSPFMGINKKLCTLRAAKKYIPESPNHKLSTLVWYCDLPKEHRVSHRALSDTEDVLHLLRHLMKVSGLSLTGLVEEFSKPQLIETIAFGKHKGTKLKDIPKGYIKWLASQDNIDDDLRFSLETICGVEF